MTGPADIQRLDPRLDEVIQPGTKPELLVDFAARPGQHWLEGPAWDRKTACLLFSDVKANAIYRWAEPDLLEVFMQPSGYSGAAPFEGPEPGSNGLAFDRGGRLLICEHGDRRIRRLEAGGRRTVVADRYLGRRLNSPNDLACLGNGDVCFTDPPYGLPQRFEDPGRELDVCGVYRVKPNGEVVLLARHLKAPNGIAFSPDETTLYVSDGDPDRSAFLAFDVARDGSLGNERVLLDVTSLPGYGGPDGLAVDRLGTVFAAGREAVFVLAADGTHLGTIPMGSITTNAGWGGDGRTLFITTERCLYRLPTLAGEAVA